MSTTNIDMEYKEVEKHFDLIKLQKLEDKDLKIVRKIVREAAEAGEPKKEITVIQKMLKEEYAFESVQYLREHVFKLNSELLIYQEGKLIETDKKDFEFTYVDKCGLIVKEYFTHYNNRVYNHTIDPFNNNKTFEKNGKFYINDMEPPKYIYNANYKKNTTFIKIYKDLIKNIICGGNEKIFPFVWQLFACLVRGCKTQGLLYLYGPQGSGKSYIIGILQLLIGLRFYSLCLSDLGQFNLNLYGKSLVNLDETKDAGDKQYRTDKDCEIAKNIKKIITCNEMPLEGKYKNPKLVKIHCNVVITSNHIICSEANGRRFCIFLCRDCYSLEEWETFKPYIVHPEHYEDELYSLYCELMEVDISKFCDNVENEYKALNISIKDDLIGDTIPNVIKYVKTLALNGKDLKTSKIEFATKCNNYLVSEHLIPIKRHTIAESLNEIKIYANEENKHTHQCMYDYTNAQLIDLLKARHFLTDEEIGYNKQKKQKEENEEDEENILDGRDETIKKLKEENEKLKKQLEELTKKIQPEVKEDIPGQKELLEELDESQEKIKITEFTGKQYNTLRDALF